MNEETPTPFEKLFSFDTFELEDLATFAVEEDFTKTPYYLNYVACTVPFYDQPNEEGRSTKFESAMFAVIIAVVTVSIFSSYLPPQEKKSEDSDTTSYKQSPVVRFYSPRAYINNPSFCSN